MSRAAQIAAFFLLGSIAASSGLEAADDAPAATFVSLKLEGACDAQNNRLWLTNTHTFKTVATTEGGTYTRCVDEPATSVTMNGGRVFGHSA